MGKTSVSPLYPSFPEDAAVVVPSDTVKLPFPSTIYVGGAGNVSVMTAQGNTVTFSGLPAGSVIPVKVARVNAALTTATLMLAIF